MPTNSLCDGLPILSMLPVSTWAYRIAASIDRFMWWYDVVLNLDSLYLNSPGASSSNFLYRSSSMILPEICRATIRTSDLPSTPSSTCLRTMYADLSAPTASHHFTATCLFPLPFLSISSWIVLVIGSIPSLNSFLMAPTVLCWLLSFAFASFLWNLVPPRASELSSSSCCLLNKSSIISVAALLSLSLVGPTWTLLWCILGKDGLPPSPQYKHSTTCYHLSLRVLTGPIKPTSR